MRRHLGRRSFLKAAAAAAAGVSIVPRHVLGQGAVPPSEKINVAGIGVAAQGRHDLQQMQSENIVALCDVDWDYAAGMFKSQPQAKKFKDYRRMLDEVKGIDGVVVATPDHMHAFASMEAIRRGKGVYCEKPLTHSVWEAREVAKAAREKKVATQMGNQGQGSTETRLLEEYVWSGIVGPIREVHVWTDRPSRGLMDEYWPQGVGRPTETVAAPANFDWDLWVGPAPMRAYHPAYHPFKWRGWWDFGTGALGDIGCHAMDPIFRALKLGHPTWVQGASTRVNEETYPLGSMVTYQFPARSAEVQGINLHAKGIEAAKAGGVEMPAVRVTWYDGGLRPPRPEGLPEGDAMGDGGRLLIGERGFILGNMRGDRVYPESLREGLTGKPTVIASSRGHYREWIDAVKGRGAAGSNFDWAGPLAEVVLLGNVALRSAMREPQTKSRLMWDPVGFKVTNVAEANRFLRREYRAGWVL